MQIGDNLGKKRAPIYLIIPWLQQAPHQPRTRQSYFSVPSHLSIQSIHPWTPVLTLIYAVQETIWPPSIPTSCLAILSRTRTRRRPSQSHLPLLPANINPNYTSRAGKQDGNQDKPWLAPVHTLTRLSVNCDRKEEEVGHKSPPRLQRMYHHRNLPHTNKLSRDTVHHKHHTTLPQAISLQVRTTSAPQQQVVWPPLLTMLQKGIPELAASKPCQAPITHNRPTSTTRPHLPMLQTGTFAPPQRHTLALSQGTGIPRPVFSS